MIEYLQRSRFNEFDPELTSIPYWYRNSTIFQYQPYHVDYNYYQSQSTVATNVYNYNQCPSKSTQFQSYNEVKVERVDQDEMIDDAQNNKRNNKQRGKKKKKRGKKLDINDQETYENLGVSKELMKFFYNGEIRRNRLRIEKLEKEKAEIEAIPSIKQQQINESKRRNSLYGKRNNYKLKQKEIAMDADFMKSLSDINIQTTKSNKLVTWPSTPLSYS